MTAIRVINSAATFDGGLDYILMKLKNHSGVNHLTNFFRKKTPCNMLTHYGLETMEKGGIQVNNFNLDFFSFSSHLKKFFQNN